MENLVMDKDFWQGKRVLLTGHTGFKGSWLALWLHALGAEVIGYALPPSTSPNLFTLANIENLITHIVGDVRDYQSLHATIKKYQPNIIFHLAAQSLVRYSYQEPVETYATNVMGTVNLLEAVRHTDGVKAVINITSDKCYENKEWYWGYRENDRLGGYDPYSNSKACAELVTEAYRNSFFKTTHNIYSQVKLASVRAGNVIGGGDWALDRLIPDIMRAYLNKQTLIIRNPEAIRPWQHVLEPLSGYLLLAENLYNSNLAFSEAWNFGPDQHDVKTVAWILKHMSHLLNNEINWQIETTEQPHEARYLSLDCAKAKQNLGWHPRWYLARGLQETANWYIAYKEQQNMYKYTRDQIERFMLEPIKDNADLDIELEFPSQQDLTAIT